MIASGGVVDLGRQWPECLVHILEESKYYFLLKRFSIAIYCHFAFVNWLKYKSIIKDGMEKTMWSFGQRMLE